MALDIIARLFSALGDLFAVERKPASALFYDARFNADVDKTARLRDSLSVDDIELRGLERGRKFVLYDLSFRSVAYHAGAVFYGVELSHVDTNGRYEFECIGKYVKKEYLAGDANCDGTVDLADAVIIMQTLSNPSKYTLTSQGKANADVYKSGDGITNNDALSIQKYLLQIITELPESYNS